MTAHTKRGARPDPSPATSTTRARTTSRFGARVVSALAVSAALVVAACSSSGSSSSSSSGTAGGKTAAPGAIDRTYAGTTITVLVPPWESYTKAQLASFTQQTGINVNVESLAFDAIHDKIVTSEAAHVSPADVTEINWSWVGQFGAAGWYQPIDNYFTAAQRSDNMLTQVFGYNGGMIAMPYNLDFRATYVNQSLFERAGITTLPTTWDQLLQDAKQLKAKGVSNYPIGVPLSVTTGGATPWYALAMSAGGGLLDAQSKPAFTDSNSAGYRALQYERSLYQNGLISPADATLTDQQVSTQFEQGAIAIELSYSPSVAASYSNPSVAAIAKTHDKVALIAVPAGGGGQAATYGDPEGLGIPKLSSHPGAAAMFISWTQLQQTMIENFDNPNAGNIPPTKSGLDALQSSGKLVSAAQISAILPTVKPLFAQGTPEWYPQFSTDAATTVQSVVQGKQGVSDGLSALAGQVSSMS